MAFALISLFEPSIVRNIYEFAIIEPTMAHVLFQNHPMLPQEEFFIMLPNERETIGELQEEMSQMKQFKENNWYPHEMHFFAPADEDENALDPEEFIDEYGALTLGLIITYKWSSDEESDSE